MFRSNVRHSVGTIDQPSGTLVNDTTNTSGPQLPAALLNTPIERCVTPDAVQSSSGQGSEKMVGGFRAHTDADAEGNDVGDPVGDGDGVCELVCEAVAVTDGVDDGKNSQ